MPDLSLTLYLLVTWGLLLLAVIAFFALAGSRRRQRRDAGVSGDPRMGPPDRRGATPDRRQGRPDPRPHKVERRRATSDRRGGMNDRRRSPAALA